MLFYEFFKTHYVNKIDINIYISILYSLFIYVLWLFTTFLPSTFTDRESEEKNRLRKTLVTKQQN
jgi:hypothetical protein